MGEIADAMIDGSTCQYCGVFLGSPTGYPRHCQGCAPVTGGPPALGGKSKRAKNRRKRRRLAASRAANVTRAANDVELLNVRTERVGIGFAVKNDGQHWIVQGQGIRVEWWPSSCKAVTGSGPSRFKRAIRVENSESLWKVIKAEFKRINGREPDGD